MSRLELTACLCLLPLGCATAPGPERASDDEADAGLMDPVVDGGVDTDAEPGQARLLAATANSDIVEGNSVACLETNGVRHFENRYYRVFDLASFGISGSLQVNEVEFGVEVASAGSGGSQAATLHLYALSGDVATGARTTLASEAIAVSDQSLSLLAVPTDADVPAGSTLLVELHTPDGRASGNSFVPGSNQSQEASPTYMQAADCAVATPTPAANEPISRPEMRWVVNVSGT